jgi:hypothetical protein
MPTTDRGEPSRVISRPASQHSDPPAAPRPGRQQLMLDQAVQGALLVRVVGHWLLCLVSTAVATWVWSVWRDPQPLTPLGALRQVGPALIGSLLVLPLAMADALRMSNRFVGPVLRLRNAMKCAAMGDDVAPLRPRQGDHWNDLIERFNQLHCRPSAGATSRLEN